MTHWRKGSSRNSSLGLGDLLSDFVEAIKSTTNPLEGLTEDRKKEEEEKANSVEYWAKKKENTPTDNT